MNDLEKQRFEELFKIKQALDEWDFEFPEKWLKERRLAFLYDEIGRLSKKVEKAKREMSKQAVIGRYFAPWTWDYPYCWTKEQREEFKTDELIRSWFEFTFNGKPVATFGELKWMIYRKRLKKLKEVQKKYKGALMRYGMTRGSITFDNEADPLTIDKMRKAPIGDILFDREQFNGGSGRIKMLCPFHEEKTPSFIIYPNNSWHCFGCHEGGSNAIDFMIKYYGLNFKEAIERLKQYV